MQLFKNVGGIIVSLNVDLVQKNEMLQDGWSIDAPEIPYSGSADASGKASKIKILKTMSFQTAKRIIFSLCFEFFNKFKN